MSTNHARNSPPGATQRVRPSQTDKAGCSQFNRSGEETAPLGRRTIPNPGRGVSIGGPSSRHIPLPPLRPRRHSHTAVCKQPSCPCLISFKALSFRFPSLGDNGCCLRVIRIQEICPPKSSGVTFQFHVLCPVLRVKRGGRGKPNRQPIRVLNT